MKVKQTNYLLKTLVAGGMILAVAGGSTLAAGPEALELIKLGDPYVGIQSKDKVVQIRSEKSIASLTPDIWYVVYYDPDATLRRRSNSASSQGKNWTSRTRDGCWNGSATPRIRWIRPN